MKQRFAFFARLGWGLCLACLSACAANPANPAQATPTAIPLPVIAAKPTYQVQRGELRQELTFSGRITPATQQELAFTVAGQVARVYVRRGDTVTQGQVLAELETGQDQFDLRRAEANLKIAQLRLELARLQTPASSEINRLQVAIQEQEVELAQVAMDELNLTYAAARLTTPMDGTVFSISILEGGQVEANQPAIVVADLDDLVISANLSLDELALLTVGMKVKLKPIGGGLAPAEGVIARLPYPYGSAETQSTDGSVQVTLPQPPAELGYGLGDLVELNLLLAQKADALWLPRQAVREFEGRYFVIVQDGETQRRVDVKVGIVEAERLEITAGLAEGQVVVAP